MPLVEIFLFIFRFLSFIFPKYYLDIEKIIYIILYKFIYIYFYKLINIKCEFIYIL